MRSARMCLHWVRLRMGMCSLLILGMLVAYPASGQALRIYHVDVEQGSATLFVSSSGRTMLVDCGRDGDGKRVRAVMSQANVSRIDQFVCTHYHDDHYGGIDELWSDPSVTPGAAWDRGDKAFLPSKTTDRASFKNYQAIAGQNAVHLTRGLTIPFDPPSISVTCIASGGVVLGEGDGASTGQDENDMSIALLVQYKTFRYFIGGDIESPTESKIAALDLVKNVDVYVADHHGAETSSTLPFMQNLSPAVIVISNGNNSVYQHPRQTTLDLFAGLSPKPVVYQTNKYLKGKKGGNVPDEYIADPLSTATTGTILVSADPMTGTFSVSYGSVSHTYTIKAGKGGSTGTPQIVIESLLPNPIGSDRELEEVTLKNKGVSPIEISDWILRDRSGRIWALSNVGAMQPGQAISIQRQGMPMSLDNDGDEITLVDGQNRPQDIFTYTSSMEGVAIETHH